MNRDLIELTAGVDMSSTTGAAAAAAEFHSRARSLLSPVDYDFLLRALEVSVRSQSRFIAAIECDLSYISANELNHPQGHARLRASARQCTEPLESGW
jgi:hypothetical protein